MVNYGDFFFSPILQYHMEAAQGQEKIWKFCPAILFRIFYRAQCTFLIT